MDKEELKRMLDNLTIEKIESFEINYKREKSYGMYNSNETQTIMYNK